MNSIQKQNRINKREKFHREKILISYVGNYVRKFQGTRFPYFLSNDTINFDLIPSKGNEDLTR